MAPHTPMYVSSSIFRGLPAQRSAAVKAASKILSKTRKPPRVQRGRIVKRTFRHVADAGEKKKSLIADAVKEVMEVMDAVAMQPMMTRSRRTSTSSVESGSSVGSRSSVSSSGSAGSGTGSRTSPVARTTRASSGLTKTKLRPRKRFVPLKKKSAPKPSAAVDKVRRERIDDDEICNGELNWSSWKPAMAPVAMDNRYEWIERRGERPGVRNIGLFTNNCDRPAVYEFAVQAPGGARKYPVLSRATAGFSGGRWDAKLLNGISVEAQLDRVMERGCKLYVRRAPFSRPIRAKDSGHVSTLNELRGLMQRTYDYAWNEHYDVPSRKYFHRNLRKDGVVISDNPSEWK